MVRNRRLRFVFGAASYFAASIALAVTAASADPQAAINWCVSAPKPASIRYIIYYTTWDGAGEKDPALGVSSLSLVKDPIDREAGIRGLVAR